MVGCNWSYVIYDIMNWEGWLVVCGFGGMDGKDKKGSQGKG